MRTSTMLTKFSLVLVLRNSSSCSRYRFLYSCIAALLDGSASVAPSMAGKRKVIVNMRNSLPNRLS